MTDDDVSFLFKKLEQITVTGERTWLIVNDLHARMVSVENTLQRIDSRLLRHEERIESLEKKAS
jgi:hypothetical protein